MFRFKSVKIIEKDAGGGISILEVTPYNAPPFIINDSTLAKTVMFQFTASALGLKQSMCPSNSDDYHQSRNAPFQGT